MAVRSKWITCLLRLSGWVAARRRRPVRPEEVSRQEWPVNARRLGVRFDEALRDDWRPRWLRVRPADAEDPRYADGQASPDTK